MRESETERGKREMGKERCEKREWAKRDRKSDLGERKAAEERWEK